MAAIKVVLDTRYDNTHHPIIVRIAHGHKRKYIPTHFKIEEKYWDGKRVVKHRDAAVINSRISDIISQAERYFAECHTSGRPINLNMVGTGPKGASFNEYLIHRAKQYDKKEMIIMARKTRRMEKELRECFGEVYFSDLTQDKLRDYEAYLIGQGNESNTRHKKFKFLQQFFTQAIQEERVTGSNPFKLYKIGTKPVQKEKLTVDEIKAIEELPLQPGPVNDARNLFLFSYYAKGARFENCITFKREQIVKDRLVFRTNKGNKYISVQIHARLRKIIKSYPGKSEFLFPYVKELPEKKKDYIKMIDVCNVIVNRNLKIVAGLAEIKPFTFHIARHSLAFHLKQVTNSIHIIQEALGHSSQRTTEIYLKALDDEFIDKEVGKLYGK